MERSEERMVNVKPVQQGKTTRMSFARIDEVLGMPNLIEVQKNSYQWFLEEGLGAVFRDISSITDYQGNLVLDFIGYRLDDKPKYTIAECKERDATYAAPMRVRASLLNKETGEVKEQDIYMGDFPLMTEAGTCIIEMPDEIIDASAATQLNNIRTMLSDTPTGGMDTNLNLGGGFHVPTDDPPGL